MSVDGEIIFHVTVAVFDQKLGAPFDSYVKVVGSKNHIQTKYLRRFLDVYAQDSRSTFDI